MLLHDAVKAKIRYTSLGQKNSCASCCSLVKIGMGGGIFILFYFVFMTRHSVWNSLPKNVDFYFSTLTIVLGIP